MVKKISRDSILECVKLGLIEFVSLARPVLSLHLNLTMEVN